MSDQEPVQPTVEAGAVSAEQAEPVWAAPPVDEEPVAARALHAPPPPLGAERPEALVGAAFGGGIVVAMLLRGLARRKHR